MVKFVLWGGPEDGVEVEVRAGDLQYVLNSPSSKMGTSAMGAMSSIPTQKACYRYNRDTKRFEWKGYLSE